MTKFLGWAKVTEIIENSLENNKRLNASQKISVRNILKRIDKTGVIIADEVGMGKTRIAVELIHAVKKAGGRTAIVVPTTLGFQWQKELNERENDLAPQYTINSLWRFMQAWADENNLKHWDEESVVLISQNFANWRVGVKSHSSRWSLIPEIFALYRKKNTKRLPNGYHNNEYLYDWNAYYGAKQIIDTIYDLPKTDNRKVVLQNIVDTFHWEKDSFNGDKFSAGNDYHELLSKAVGLGLGSFDLVVIDEAHKSRGDNSSLSRILDKVIIQNDSGRRLALTATPVELDVGQWQKMLSRIQLADEIKKTISQSIDNYATAVNKLRQSWKTDEQSRVYFKKAAREFESALKPYLLRRDKRQDLTIQAFHLISNKPINAYRQHTQVEIEVDELSDKWKRIVCTVEGLSAASSMQDDSVSKRARLTLANGHGIAGIIDNSSSSDQKDEVLDCEEVILDTKKLQRASWWKNQITKVYQNGDESLYQHPAILKTITEIELNLEANQKALVFGKLTKPMRILVNLLNAREMLRRLDKGQFWPQTKVHGSDQDSSDDSEVRAVEFATKQLGLNWNIDEINIRLKRQYDKHANQIEQTKQHLIENIEQSISTLDARCQSLFNAFKNSITKSEIENNSALIFITRAIYELSDSNDFKLNSQEVAQGFVDLMGAITAENEIDDNKLKNDSASEKGKLNEKAHVLWPEVEIRIKEEFEHVRGGMARLMYGQTSASSRRVLQLGFNRHNSFPKVLVAQSVVGREGLNLHEACRIVYLLHPEWNPGVVEQQIGRVDRLGSQWEKEFNAINTTGVNASDLPYIEVKPIVFKGTYDEYNWQVLQERWNKLRSQLHGVVIPECERDDAYSELYDELCNAAPNFSPTE